MEPDVVGLSAPPRHGLPFSHDAQPSMDIPAQDIPAPTPAAEGAPEIGLLHLPCSVLLDIISLCNGHTQRKLRATCKAMRTAISITHINLAATLVAQSVRESGLHEFLVRFCKTATFARIELDLLEGVSTHASKSLGTWKPMLPDASEFIIRVVPALSRATRLTSVDAACHRGIVAHLVANCKQLQTLKLFPFRRFNFSAPAVQLLPGLSSLQELALNHVCVPLFGPDFREFTILQQMTQLRSLTWHGLLPGDISVVVGQLSLLTRLDLNMRDTSRAGTSVGSFALPALKSLSFNVNHYYMKRVHGVSLSGLFNCSGGMTRLETSVGCFSRPDLKLFPQLAHLTVRQLELTEEVIADLSVCSQLTSLDVEAMKVASQPTIAYRKTGIVTTANLAALQHLRIVSKLNCTVPLSWLMPCLQELDCSSCDSGDLECVAGHQMLACLHLTSKFPSFSNVDCLSSLAALTSLHVQFRNCAHFADTPDEDALARNSEALAEVHLPQVKDLLVTGFLTEELAYLPHVLGAAPTAMHVGITLSKVQSASRRPDMHYAADMKFAAHMKGIPLVLASMQQLKSLDLCPAMVLGIALTGAIDLAEFLLGLAASPCLAQVFLVEDVLVDRTKAAAWGLTDSVAQISMRQQMLQQLQMAADNRALRFEVLWK